MKKKIPTLDEFKANTKNCPLHKERSSQFKKGMIAGYIETVDMINGIYYKQNNKLHPCKCTDYNGSQCYNCLNGFHEGCSKKCNAKNSKNMGVAIIIKKHTKKP